MFLNTKRSYDKSSDLRVPVNSIYPATLSRFCSFSVIAKKVRQRTQVRCRAFCFLFFLAVVALALGGKAVFGSCAAQEGYRPVLRSAAPSRLCSPLALRKAALRVRSAKLHVHLCFVCYSLCSPPGLLRQLHTGRLRWATPYPCSAASSHSRSASRALAVSSGSDGNPGLFFFLFQRGNPLLNGIPVERKKPLRCGAGAFYI